MSKTDYLIRTLSEHEIKVYPGLREILVELKKQEIKLAWSTGDVGCVYLSALHLLSKVGGVRFLHCFTK